MSQSISVLITAVKKFISYLPKTIKQEDNRKKMKPKITAILEILFACLVLLTRLLDQINKQKGKDKNKKEKDKH
jgi:hypothetical protein